MRHYRQCSEKSTEARAAWKKRCWHGAWMIAGTMLLCGAVLLTISGAVAVRENEKILSSESLEAAGSTYDCVLVLGCRVHEDGSLSQMLADRVRTGAELVLQGYAKRIIMSGDRHGAYDEVGAMKQYAISLGVPEECILEDGSGFSTFESMENLAKEEHGMRILVVTQEYHLPRALYIAERMGMDAYGVPADLRTYRGQLRRDVREVLARTKDVVYTQIRKGTASDR